MSMYELLFESFFFNYCEYSTIHSKKKTTELTFFDLFLAGLPYTGSVINEWNKIIWAQICSILIFFILVPRMVNMDIAMIRQNLKVKN